MGPGVSNPERQATRPVARDSARKPGLFQIHLSTAIILSIAAGGLLAVNVAIFLAGARESALQEMNPRLFWLAEYVTRAVSISGSLVLLWLLRDFCEWWIRTDW